MMFTQSFAMDCSNEWDLCPSVGSGWDLCLKCLQWMGPVSKCLSFIYCRNYPVMLQIRSVHWQQLAGVREGALGLGMHNVCRLL